MAVPSHGRGMGQQQIMMCEDLTNPNIFFAFCQNCLLVNQNRLHSLALFMLALHIPIDNILNVS